MLSHCLHWCSFKVNPSFYLASCQAGSKGSLFPLLQLLQQALSCGAETKNIFPLKQEIYSVAHTTFSLLRKNMIHKILPYGNMQTLILMPFYKKTPQTFKTEKIKLKHE